MLADLVVDLLVSEIGRRAQPGALKSTDDLRGIVIGIRGDGGHHDLPGRQPQRQVACEVLDQDADEPLQGTEERAVQQHRSMPVAVLSDIGRAQPAGQVQVDLQRSALPLAADGVLERELDFRPVESPFAGVVGVVQAKRIHGLLQRLLGPVPYPVIPDPAFRTVGELDHHVLKTHVPVDAEHQVADRARLLGDLVGRAENVGIVLGKGPNPHQAVKRAGGFVTVHLAELGQAQGQLPIAAQLVREHLNMPGAVHWLYRPQAFVLGAAGEHVLAERIPVPGRLPQTAVHEFGGVDLEVARRILSTAHVRHQRPEQRPAPVVPEHRSHRLVLKMEQVHLPPQPAVVAPLGLFQAAQVQSQFLVARPGGAVDALQHFIPGVAPPVGAGQFGEFEGAPQPPGGGHVGSAAEVDELPLPVHGDFLALGNVADDLGLVGFALIPEEIHCARSVPDLAGNRFVASDDVVHPRFDALEILRCEGFIAGEVVVKAVLNGRADGDLGLRIEFLDRFRHDVGRVMSQDFQSIRR